MEEICRWGGLVGRSWRMGAPLGLVGPDLVLAVWASSLTGSLPRGLGFAVTSRIIDREA